MKKLLIIDISFIVLLGVVLVILNEIQLIILTDHKYIYIALLAAYFTGRRITDFMNTKRNKTV